MHIYFILCEHINNTRYISKLIGTKLLQTLLTVSKSGMRDWQKFTSGSQSRLIHAWSICTGSVSLLWAGQHVEELLIQLLSVKGTVSPDYKCLEVISIKDPLLGHVTLDIETLPLISNGLSKFLSILRQTHSNSPFYWNMNSVNTRSIPYYTKYIPDYTLDTFQKYVRCSWLSWNTDNVTLDAIQWQEWTLSTFQLHLDHLILLLECI
jgi:hypothetical protein